MTEEFVSSEKVLEEGNTEEINSSVLAKELIEQGDITLLIDDIKKFEGLNLEVAERLIVARKADVLLENLTQFEVDHNKLAKIMMEQGEVYALAKKS
jgi:hypothetical protein